MCKRVLGKALSKGGDFADLYFEHTISNSLGLEDKKVDRAYTSVNLGVGIRTVKGDQVGFGFTQELTEKSMMAAAAMAATIADGSGDSRRRQIHGCQSGRLLSADGHKALAIVASAFAC